MNRDEHLAWCKSRALKYLKDGEIANGVTSMLSDMDKHPETKLAPGSILSMMGMQAIMSGDIKEARRFIEGFN